MSQVSGILFNPVAIQFHSHQYFLRLNMAAEYFDNPTQGRKDLDESIPQQG